MKMRDVMLKSIKKPFLIAFTSLLPFVGLSQTVSAQSIGILGLYEFKGNVKPSLDLAKVKGLGCELYREGHVMGESGDIDIAEPTHFIMLACEASLLSDQKSREALQATVPQGKMITILEGDLSAYANAEPVSKVTGRSYIIKISHYNNEDTDQREGTLKKLSQMVKTRAHNYKTEAIIDVNRALGMATPDEAVLIYYDQAGDGEKFRAGNPDIMKVLGRFNKNHLNDYIYYDGQVIR